jgi:mycobactin salicyl-AMP ligase
MNARAAAAVVVQERAPADPLAWGSTRLSSLLAATGERHALRTAFKDDWARQVWSGRPPAQWTYPSAFELVQRLAGFLVKLKLAPKSPIGICLPNGSEACLSILAAEHAGLVPCLLPVAWSEEELALAMEATKPAAIITQATIANERPADVFCRLAPRHFRLRFICAFGPSVPDGVTDLDRMVLGPEGKSLKSTTMPEPAAEGGIVTFQRRRDGVRAVFRASQSIVAAGAKLLATAKIQAGERILSLMAPDDHRGLTTGLIAALLSGATLECHGLFGGRSFVAALEDTTPTHLVAPAWMEATLGRAKLPSGVTSVILVHEAPTRFKAKTVLRGSIIDVLGFGETALVAAPRRASGQFAISLDDDSAPAAGKSRQLLRIKRDEGDAIHFGGLAAEVHDFERGAVRLALPRLEWRPSGFKAETFAGIMIGVSEQG